jgi:TatD DNase family protein
MAPKYIDAHSHLQFVAFDNDREEVLGRALEHDTWMINVGTQYDTSKNAVELAQGREGVFAAIGIHPIHTGKSFHDEQELGEGGAEFTSRGEEFDYDKYKELALNPKVVGIGECGLDYYRLEEGTAEKQRRSLEAQIALANEVGKPLMLHVRNGISGERNAYRDIVEILKSANLKVAGDVHFFAGSIEDARAFLDLGFTLSFTGAITFSKSNKPGMVDYAELVRYIPLDHILTETDSPYVAPRPFRGKRNEPLFVEKIAAKIAEIKGLPLNETAPVLVANARRVFGI